MDTSRQMTIRALILGALLSAVLAAANMYLGLLAGMTVSASIPAAVVSMGLLYLLKNSNPLENNLVQTTASAGEALAAGAIFTLPALVLLGYWEGFDYGWTVMLTGLGGLLGVLFTVPLRHALIIDAQLAYPEGAATAGVLEQGHEGGKGLKLLAGAALIGGIVKFAESGLRLWSTSVETAGRLGNGIFYAGTNLSPALLGVGYIVGLNIALLVFAGGVMAWYIAVPLYSALIIPDDPRPAAELAWEIWNTRIRYLGVGAMLVGGLWTLFAIRHELRRALELGLSGGERGHHKLNQPHEDMPMRWVMLAIAGCAIPLWLIYQNVLGSVGASLPLAILMLVAAFLFSAVAAYMAGVVGSSHNPVSGVTIATILMASLLLVLMLGADAVGGPAAAIMVGAVVCCAAAIGGDTLQDLKAGHMLGATPWKQQIAQILGVVVAALVIAPVLTLLHNAYGIGAATMAHPDPLTAPQATLMASVAQGVFGGGLPWTMIWIGAGLGSAIILFDLWLKRRNSQWHAPVLAVAIGVYLPLELAMPIAAGGLIAWLVRRDIGPSVGLKFNEVGHKGLDRGALAAAGLITGEALLGIALAVPVGIFGKNPFAVGTGALWWLGLAVVLGCAFWLYRVAKQQEPAS